MNHVVVWDPEGRYWEGSLVDQHVAATIRGRGGVVLPADASLFQVSGCGGFFKRAWGAGWPCDFAVPRMFCPMTLFLTKDHRVIHWAARLVPDERHQTAENGPPDSPGTIQIISVPARANLYQAAITPRTNAKSIREFGPVDSEGGWSIGGHAYATVMNEGNHSFGLYGSGSGVRVAWAAISAVKT